MTYLTLRQWGRAESGEVPGVRVVTAGPRLKLYADGRRRILPPLVFGVGVLRHLLAARARLRPRADRLVPVLRPARRGRRPPPERLRAGRRLARGVDARVLARLPRPARRRSAGGCSGAASASGSRLSCPSELHARRLRDEGARGPVIVYRGLYAGAADVGAARGGAGRRLRRPPHPREARRPRSLPAVALARESFPELRGEILGDGPDRPEVLRQIAEAGLGGVVEAPGFVSPGADGAVARTCAVPAAAVRTRGLRADRRRGGGAGCPEHRRRGTRQRRDGARRGGSQRVRRPVGGAGRPGRGHRSRSRRRAGAPRLDEALVRRSRRRALGCEHGRDRVGPRWPGSSQA